MAGDAAPSPPVVHVVDFILDTRGMGLRGRLSKSVEGGQRGWERACGLRKEKRSDNRKGPTCRRKKPYRENSKYTPSVPKCRLFWLF